MTILALTLSAAVLQASACPAPKIWGVTVPVAGLQPLANIVRFERGHITWNHVPIDEQSLQKYLVATTKLVPQPRLVVDIDPMDCATLSLIVATVERAGVDCGYGRCIATDVIDPPAPPAPPPPSRRD